MKTVLLVIFYLAFDRKIGLSERGKGLNLLTFGWA